MKMPRRKVRRRGVAIVPVLVCFALVLLMSTVLLKIGLAHRKQAQAEERRSQAEWLAEAGLERAGAKLATARDYHGETWQVSERDLDGRDPGAVTIKVQAVPDHPTRRLVRVVADFPRDVEKRARQSHEVVVDLGPEKEGTQR